MKLISKKLLSAFLCVLTISTISKAGDDAVVWSYSNSHEKIYEQYEASSDALVKVNSYIVTNSNELEVKCSVVTSTLSNRVNAVERGDQYGDTYTVNLYYTDATVTCEKRNYADSASISLANFCIENPNEKCFDPEVMKRISKVKPTKYKR